MKELIEYIYLHEKDISDIFNKTNVEIQSLYHQIVRTQTGIAIGGLIFGLIILIVSSISISLIIKNDRIDGDLKCLFVCVIVVVGGIVGSITTTLNLISLIEWINEPTLKVFEHIKYMLS